MSTAKSNSANLANFSLRIVKFSFVKISSLKVNIALGTKIRFCLPIRDFSTISTFLSESLHIQKNWIASVSATRELAPCSLQRAVNPATRCRTIITVLICTVTNRQWVFFVVQQPSLVVWMILIVHSFHRCYSNSNINKCKDLIYLVGPNLADHKILQGVIKALLVLRAKYTQR